MLPLADEDRPGRPLPFVNLGLIAAGALVFAYTVTRRDAPAAPDCAGLREAAGAVVDQGARTAQGFVCRFGAVPDELRRDRGLHTMVTATFLHGGLLHLAFDAAFLWVFGDNVEDALGHVAYLAFFLGAGVVGNVAHVVVDPGSAVAVVGAGASVSAVLAAYLVFWGATTVRVVIGPFFASLPSWAVAGAWGLEQLLATAVLADRAPQAGGVAFESSAAGFALGGALALALRAVLARFGHWPLPGVERATARTTPRLGAGLRPSSSEQDPR